MRKSILFTRLMPGLLLATGAALWLPVAHAQGAAPPVVAVPAPDSGGEDTAAEPAAQATAPAAKKKAPAAGTAAPAPQPAATAEQAGPAAEQAAAAEETTAPTAETTEEASAEEPAYRGRYGYRARHNRLIEQRKAMMEARREQMERWRSWRRWWDNPGAENRRMWNRARSQMYRDMAEARMDYYRQNRPRYYEYDVPRGSGYYEEWTYPDPWGGPRW